MVTFGRSVQYGSGSALPGLFAEQRTYACMRPRSVRGTPGVRACGLRGLQPRLVIPKEKINGGRLVGRYETTVLLLSLAISFYFWHCRTPASDSEFIPRLASELFWATLLAFCLSPTHVPNVFLRVSESTPWVSVRHLNCGPVEAR